MVSRYGRCALGLLLLLSLLSASPTRAAATTYTDPQNRFSVLALDAFHQQANPPPPISVSFLTDQPSGTGYNVEVEDETGDIGPTGTLADEVPFALKTFAAFDGYMPVQEGVQTTTLGGRDARSHEFHGHLSGADVHLLIVFTLIGVTGYSVVFNTLDSDWDRYADARQQVLDSFTFLPGITATPRAVPSATPVAVPSLFTNSRGLYRFTVPVGYRLAGATETVPGFTLRLGNVTDTFVSTLSDETNFITGASGIDPTMRPTSLDAGTAQFRDGLLQQGSHLAPGDGDIQPLTLGGQDARMFDLYVTRDMLPRLHGIVVVSLVGNVLYTLTFMAREDNYGMLQGDEQRVVSTFQIPQGISTMGTPTPTPTP